MKMSTRYIEIVGGVGIWQAYLVDADLYNIGEFTRENVAEWLGETSREPAMFPIEDFHAVCDGIDIPWATEKGREHYQHVMEKQK